LRTRLLTALRGLVNIKRQRIRAEMGNPNPSRHLIQRAREGLDPEGQIAIILERMADFLHQQLPPREQSTRQNFRIGLYVDRDGVMKPLDGFDFHAKKHDPFTSYLDHEARFRVDNQTNPAHVVKCVQERRLLIVPDCAREAGFQHFNEEQKTYLKSLAAYPIIPFRQSARAERAAALVVDTDVAGFFQEEQREAMDFVMQEFGARLSLEDMIQKLLAL
jgi:hypothetical protein